MKCEVFLSLKELFFFIGKVVDILYIMCFAAHNCLFFFEKLRMFNKIRGKTCHPKIL